MNIYIYICMSKVIMIIVGINITLIPLNEENEDMLKNKYWIKSNSF